MSDDLIVNEIYLSLQGEGSWAGWPCVFVRLTGCPSRCSYCDTAYAFREGRRMSIDAIVARAAELARPFGGASAGEVRLPLVEVTGGEPLAQKGTLALLTALCDQGYRVLLETSGALDIAPVDPRVLRVMDLKCPSSGEDVRNRLENIAVLRKTDEVKFVVATAEDYVWAREMMVRHALREVCTVLVSWATALTPEQHDPSLKPMPAGHHAITRQELAERLVRDALPVRFQLQMHKFIWAPDRRGV